jgi:concentrative nucleoside transporter, CNT family
MEKVFPNGFVFAFTALPTIIFVSSFFTVLYYFGVLQFIVRIMAKRDDVPDADERRRDALGGRQRVHGPDRGAAHRQALRAAMTQSELLAMMVGGMATISGGVMAVYIASAPTRWPS